MQQVTAREGRPIVICEKDDFETKSLAWQTIDVPHTVDCLQVTYSYIKHWFLGFYISYLISKVFFHRLGTDCIKLIYFIFFSLIITIEFNTWYCDKFKLGDRW